MPLRAFRASRAHIAGHMGENLWMWIGISAAGAAFSGLLMYYFEIGNTHKDSDSLWANVMVFFAMLLGSLIMVKSEKSGVQPDAVLDDSEQATVLPAQSGAR